MIASAIYATPRLDNRADPGTRDLPRSGCRNQRTMGETPMNVAAKGIIAGSMALFLAACGDSAKLPEEAAFGPTPSISPQRRVGRKARAPRPRPAFRSKASRSAWTIRVGFTSFQTVTFSSPKPMLRRGRRTNAASRAGFLE